MYLAEVNVSSKKLQIASKMYFRSSRVKSEMHFYEGLPRDDNILQVHGCYMDLRRSAGASRWSTAGMGTYASVWRGRRSRETVVSCTTG